MYALLIVAFLAFLLGLLVVVCKQAIAPKKKHLPSGKAFPDDKQLLIISIDQLMTDYKKEDLDSLLHYVSEKYNEEVSKEEKVKWNDLYRRVHTALYGHY